MVVYAKYKYGSETVREVKVAKNYSKYFEKIIRSRDLRNSRPILFPFLVLRLCERYIQDIFILEVIYSSYKNNWNQMCHHQSMNHWKKKVEKRPFPNTFKEKKWKQ